MRHAQQLRVSTKNQGTWLERDIQRCCDVYREKCLLDLAKVEPPTRVLWTPKARRRPGQPEQTVLQLPNPFLDYVGAWRERGGRAVFLEVKSTSEPRLGIMQSSGIRDAQFFALQRWARAGGAVGVLWAHREELRFLPLEALEVRLKDGVKHVKWEHARAIPRGMGWLTWDFLQVLRLYNPEH